MPLSFKSLRDAIHDWITAETGIVAIWRDQNAPKPKNPHFVLALDSFVEVHEDIVLTSDGTDIEIEGTRDFTLLITGFGDLIIENTEKARSSLNKPSVRQTLRTAKIIVWDKLPVINLTGLFDTKFEERSSCDIMMRTDNIITDSIGIIEEIKDIEGTYKQAGKPDKVETFTVKTP